MKKSKSKFTKFWIKFSARFLDFIFLCTFIIAIGFSLLSRMGGKYNFDSPWKFYIWLLTSMFLLLLWFVVIPILSKGSSLGMLILRVKIISLDNRLNKSILKREVFFTFIWVINIIFLMSVINHTLFQKYIYFISGDKSISLSVYDNLRISFVTSIGSITTTIQIVLAVSVLVKKNGQGLHDLYAKTLVVPIGVKEVNNDNRTEEGQIVLKTYKKNNKPIIWV